MCYFLIYIKILTAPLQKVLEADVVVHNCNPSTQEAQAQGFLIQG
jgi:O-acetyl-ADP-ribose deacetylase (regulator of RNase III)